MNKFKTLLQQQKRLIVIFLMTIVLPSLALGTFGVLALKNEKYRFEQQEAEERGNILALLKKQFAEHLKSGESVLQNAAWLNDFQKRDYSAIKLRLNLILTDDRPVDQVFILFNDSKVFFPLLEGWPETNENTGFVLTQEQQTLLERAQKAEFTNKDYITAVSLYRELLSKVTDQNTAAQMLSSIARVYKKSGEITSAINTYARIIEQYSASAAPAGLPLTLSAEMQIIECKQITGNKNGAFSDAFSLYNNILDGKWKLNESQFVFYADMSKALIENLISSGITAMPVQDAQTQFASLKEKQLTRLRQWKDRIKIESEIIPVLKEMTSRSIAEPVHISRRVMSEDFLISALPVSGFICIKWNTYRIISEWLKPAANNLTANKKFKIIITDAAGKTLTGNENQVNDASAVTGEFDNFFPPWKIRIVKSGLVGEAGFNLFTSYYFWSVLTLLVILIFGTLLILRIIEREREVMNIKSSFIASVSHELKTPLTSIRALIERLLAGKVQNPEKMNEYFSVIDQEANKLTRLVKNILDFSKIEEGKKEYSFEETDIAGWLDETIAGFYNDHAHEQIEIKKNFSLEIPHVEIDGDALSQCINNLLDNAIKFSPDSRSVEIELNKNPDFIIIDIKDRGIGIIKEDLPKIFDKFFQSSASPKSSVKGAGLGLALAKHAVEAHGGRIEVKSSPGHGSVFSIFLPLAKHTLRSS